jgi:hypothetical protein
MKISIFILIGLDQNFRTIFIEIFDHFYRKKQPKYQKILTIFIEIFDHLLENFDHFLPLCPHSFFQLDF